jgi:hypothetical protein
MSILAHDRIISNMYIPGWSWPNIKTRDTENKMIRAHSWELRKVNGY